MSKDMKKYIKYINRVNRRGFLVGTGTVLGLPFLESLFFSRHIKAQGAVNPRVILGFIDNNFRMDLDRKNGMEQRLEDVFNPVKTKTNIYYKARCNIYKRSAAGLHPPSNRVWSVGHNNSEGRKSFDLMALTKTGRGRVTESMQISAVRTASYWRATYDGSSYDGVEPVDNLSAAFKKLFPSQNNNNMLRANTPEDLKKLLQKSSLDYVMESLNDIKRKISSADKQTVDRYLTNVREIEVQVNKQGPEPEERSVSCPVVNNPNGNYNLKQRLEIIANMTVAAFCGDATRCMSIASHDNWGRSETINYPDFLNISKRMKRDMNYHELSHGLAKGTDKEKIDAFFAIDQMRLGTFVKIATELDKFKEANNLSILDNSIIRVGDGFSTTGTGKDGGGRGGHEQDFNTTVSIGSFGGKIKTGLQLDNKGQLQSNINDRLLRAMGVDLTSFGKASGDKFGDSDGKGISLDDVKA